MKQKKRVLQGMRPTGTLHLGNYFGTAKGMLALQEDPDYETYYMVADLHGITTPFDPEKININSRSVIVDYLSVGLDPNKSAIFIQSDLADLHTQLAFYFSAVVTVARMQHLPTFKEKVKQYPNNATMALLNYPVLMAADILIYKAEMVPVGLDQEPHMEITREIARKMNSEYNTDFPEPQRFKSKGEYVPSLLGEGKMSKSVEGSYINLIDDLETIREKLAKVPTDSGRGYIKNGFYISQTAVPRGVGIVAESGGLKTLMYFIELFEGKEKREEYEKKYVGEGIRYKELKDNLAEAIYKDLEPIREKRKELEAKPEYVDEVIRIGGEKARKLAQITINEVKEKMGLRGGL